MRTEPEGPLLYDATAMVVGYSNGVITPHARNTVRRFLEATKQEDEWIAAERYLNGSLALLMRSMLCEAGSPAEKKVEEKLPAVRQALHAFTQGTPVPAELRFATAVSIKYWKEVAAWNERVVTPLIAALPQRLRM